MKVLDLRPWWVRTALAAWRRGGGVRSGGRTLADHWIGRRVQRRDPLPAGPPWLVSVGNLALGGTGKTPVVGKLAADLASRGRRGAILVRGFGSSLRGPALVTPQHAAAGDEARWHAACLENTGWLVCQSRDRVAGLRWLRDRYPELDYVLLEDAHQTAGLPRHLDVVILDRWTIENESGQLIAGTGRVFPAGPWRESAQGAVRADLLLVEAQDPVPAGSDHGQPVGSFARRLSLREARTAGTRIPDSRRWAALSGIAHPDRFEAGVAEELGCSPVLTVRCGDHQQYRESLLARIISEMEQAGADTLVTTAKDWVKLESLWPAGSAVLIADLELEWGQKNALPDWIEERVGSVVPRGL